MCDGQLRGGRLVREENYSLARVALHSNGTSVGVEIGRDYLTIAHRTDYSYLGNQLENDLGPDWVVCQLVLYGELSPTYLSRTLFIFRLFYCPFFVAVYISYFSQFYVFLSRLS